MSDDAYLLCPADQDPEDLDVLLGPYCLPVGWVLAFGPAASATGPGRMEGTTDGARDRWARVLATPDPYLRGVLGPVAVLAGNLPTGTSLAIDATELLGMNPEHDDFIEHLQDVSDAALAAIEAGDRAAAVEALNRWYVTGALRFSGSGEGDRAWALAAEHLVGDTAEVRWGLLVAGVRDSAGWEDAVTAAVRFEG